MKAKKDEGWLSRYVKGNSMQSHLDVEKEEGRERETHGSEKDKTSREICLPDGEGSVLLQQGDNREKETVEERRRGRAGGQEPTCRLGAETVASEGRSEEKRNFNDPETSPAGLEGWNATDTCLVLLQKIFDLTIGEREDSSPLVKLNIRGIVYKDHPHHQLSTLPCHAINILHVSVCHCVFWIPGASFHSCRKLVNDFFKFLFTRACVTPFLSQPELMSQAQLWPERDVSITEWCDLLFSFLCQAISLSLFLCLSLCSSYQFWSRWLHRPAVDCLAWLNDYGPLACVWRRGVCSVGRGSFGFHSPSLFGPMSACQTSYTSSLYNDLMLFIDHFNTTWLL